MSGKKNNKELKTTTFNSQNIFEFNKVLGYILSAIAFVIYWNTLNHSYVFDDFTLIKDNAVTTLGIKGIPDIFSHFYRYGFSSTNDGIYRPLSVAMFALEWSLSPNNPSLSHFVNILLYALTAWVLFNTLRRLLKNYNVALPFVITLLFITHPVHTEVVANIKSRDELLCFLLSFGTLYFLIDYVESNSVTKLLVASVLFFLAFLSKETAITMLVVIPMALYFFTDVSKKSFIITTACLSMVTIVFLVIRAKILSAAVAEAVPVIINPLLLASNIFDRWATAIKILGEYLGLVIYPNILMYDRSFNQIPIVSFSNVYVIISLLVYAGMFVYALYKFLKKDFLAFGILFYLLTIAIFSNIFFIIGVAMADRFLYFPSFGFCFALTTLLMKLTKANFNSIRFNGIQDFFNKNKTLLVVAVTISFLYSFKTINRNANWKDNYTLFSHDAEISPNNSLTHYHLGYEIIKNILPVENDPYKRLSMGTQAINELKKSLVIYPNHVNALNSLGIGYFLMDSLQAAENSFKKAIAIDSSDLSKIGDFYFSTKNYNKSIEIYKRAVTKNPNYVGGFINLGICYGTISDYKNAITYFTKAVTLQPSNAQINYFLSTAYKLNGDSSNYEKYYQKAYQLDPSLTRP